MEPEASGEDGEYAYGTGTSISIAQVNIERLSHQLSAMGNTPTYTERHSNNDLIDDVVENPFETEQDNSMPNKIQRYLQGEKVDGIDDAVIEEYYAKEKKLRFLVKDERDGLHKPLSDGKKPTSSVKLDDLVPKD